MRTYSYIHLESFFTLRLKHPFSGYYIIGRRCVLTIYDGKSDELGRVIATLAILFTEVFLEYLNFKNFCHLVKEERHEKLYIE